MTTVAPARTSIPPLIRRNTTLLALALSFSGASMGLAYGLGPLMVLEITHSNALAGLSVALIALARFLVAYPIGQITDRYGRKPGILLGLALGMAGALVLGIAMQVRSTGGFVAGLLVFAMGIHAAQQLRVAATDMFPPRMRARALGFVSLGSMVGLILCPILITIGEHLAPHVGVDPLGLPWLLTPLLIVPGMLVVRRIRPDPKEIGMNLAQYYPDVGLVPERPRDPGAARFSGWHLLRQLRPRLAIVSNGASTGNMSIVMVLTSLVLAHHGHSLSMIAFSHMFHTAGMFAFTIPLGMLADRLGRWPVMVPGVATTIVGAGLVGFTEGFWMVTLGTFLVGLGWAAANVTATALLADHVRTTERGRAIGTNDSFAGAISVAVAVATGPLIEAAGLPAAGWLAVAIAAVPMLMFAAALGARGRQPTA